jgi:hypothetical protein
MGREVHGADVEDGGLVDLILNAHDLLQVVLSPVVPAAPESGHLHAALDVPDALEADLGQLPLALRERDGHRVLVEGLHGVGLLEARLDLRLQFLLDR